VFEGVDGNQLVEYDFKDHKELIDTIIQQAKDCFEIEPEITVFGKRCRQPRDVQFRSDESKGYFYSNQVMEAQQLTEEMRELLRTVNASLGAKYNGILFNRYKNGKKTVGAHGDSEGGLDAKAGVLAISYGATRTFRVRDAARKCIVGDFTSKHLKALQMRGPTFQRKYTHEIPAQAKVLGERISLTFRKHVPEEEARLFAKVAAQKRKRVE
jgi:alkylated DNA repair dioxygenase AlkB